MTSTSAAAIMPLCKAYRKSSVNVAVMGGVNHEEKRDISLPPVLYHGTAKLIIDRAINSQVTLTRLSLSSSPSIAAGYASYQIEHNGSGRYFLINDMKRRFLAVEDHPDGNRKDSPEIRNLKRGVVKSSLALFDRDALLKSLLFNSDISIFDDEGGRDRNGLQLLNRDGFNYPSDSLIGTFDYQSNGRISKAITISFHLNNPVLWNNNFVVGPFANQLRFGSKTPTLPFELFYRFGYQIEGDR